MCSQVLHGWRFWSVEGTEKPKREPKAKADKPTKAKKDSTATKPARTKAASKKKGAKGKSVPMASDASYGCGVCPETFPTQKKAVAHAMTHTA